MTVIVVKRRIFITFLHKIVNMILNHVKDLYYRGCLSVLLEMLNKCESKLLYTCRIKWL